MGRKVGFAAVFTKITRRGSLPEETSIHIDEMTAIKVALKWVHKRENKKWVVFRLSEQSIEYNKENHPIQIYNILTKF